MPRRQTKRLLQILLATLIAGLVSLWVISKFSITYSLYVPNNFSEYLHIALFFISLTLAYMITYSAIEVDSPSLLMIMAITEAGLEGLDKKELEQKMSDEILIKPRFEDIIIHRMSYLEGHKYKLTRKGSFIAKIFIFYRKILNLGKGG